MPLVEENAGGGDPTVLKQILAEYKAADAARNAPPSKTSASGSSTSHKPSPSATKHSVQPKRAGPPKRSTTTPQRNRTQPRAAGAGLTAKFASALPSMSVAYTSRKSAHIQTPEASIVIHTSATALVSEERGSPLSVAFDPKRRRGALALNGKDVALTIGGVLKQAELRNRDIAEVFSVAAVFSKAGRTVGHVDRAVSLGTVSIPVGGRKVSAPVTADVSISASLPNKIEAKVAVEVPVWSKHGLTTIQVEVAVEAKATVNPRYRSRPPAPDPVAERAWEAVKNGLQDITKVLQKAEKSPYLPVPGRPGGSSEPIP